MILSFDADLTRQEILAQGVELAQIMGRDRDAEGRRVAAWPDEESQPVTVLSNPVLVTDHAKIATLSPVLRDTLFALYASPLKEIRYDGTVLPFVQSRHPGVWGPSIDTLFFCRTLSRLDLGTPRRVLEIGCGSGFITKHLLASIPGAVEATLVDVSPAAVACARESVTDHRARFAVGDGLDYLGSGEWDLVMCNPPYIPRPASIDDNPYEGVGLLAQLIIDGRRHLASGGTLLVNVSSLCRPIVAPLLAEAGATPRNHMEVPLKVFNVLNSPDWMSYLHASAGLTREFRDGYDYWHTITMTEIRA